MTRAQVQCLALGTGAFGGRGGLDHLRYITVVYAIVR